LFEISKYSLSLFSKKLIIGSFSLESWANGITRLEHK
jgi:hypothetical protein